jgi:gluconolactonase
MNHARLKHGRGGYGPAMIDMLAWGFGLIEGPRPDPAGNLYFSDVTRGGVHRLAPDGSVTVAVPKRRGVGGIALHADGGLVLSGRNICHVRDGETRIVFELPDVGGFNDLFTDAAGRVYVGSLRDDPFSVGADRTPGEAYRIDTDGHVTQIYGDVGLTNGIGFSPDGRRLYHSDSAIQSILVHDVDADGNVDASSREVFARVKGGVPDGLAVDDEGGVWVAVYGGNRVERFARDGTSDRSITVPAEGVTSLAFAGPDLSDLIVVSADNTAHPEREGTVFLVPADEVGARGLPAPLARV